MRKQTDRTFFHHRFYRYVRMMLRRYPKMRNEIYGLRSNNGVQSIIRAAGDTRTYRTRLEAAMFGGL
jgi:hypothetical protein